MWYLLVGVDLMLVRTVITHPQRNVSVLFERLQSIGKYQKLEFLFCPNFQYSI